MKLSLLSFSYKLGLPAEADFVFDARFLQNPHYLPHLTDKTGLDADVGAYIREDAEFERFMVHILLLIEPLLPRFIAKDKEQVMIAVGCTGGKHRSVYSVQTLAALLRDAGYAPEVHHRELERI